MAMEQKALWMYLGYMADNKPRGARVPILLTKEEIEMLDDRQFTNRIRTRAEAIRELMRRGYKAPYQEKDEGGKK